MFLFPSVALWFLFSLLMFQFSLHAIIVHVQCFISTFRMIFILIQVLCLVTFCASLTLVLDYSEWHLAFFRILRQTLMLYEDESLYCFLNNFGAFLYMWTCLVSEKTDIQGFLSIWSRSAIELTFTTRLALQFHFRSVPACFFSVKLLLMYSAWLFSITRWESF